MTFFDIEIRQKLTNLDPETLASLVGQLILETLDLANAYSLGEEFANCISDVLGEHEIPHKITEEDV